LPIFAILVAVSPHF